MLLRAPASCAWRIGGRGLDGIGRTTARPRTAAAARIRCSGPDPVAPPVCRAAPRFVWLRVPGSRADRRRCVVVLVWMLIGSAVSVPNNNRGRKRKVRCTWLVECEAIEKPRRCLNPVKKRVGIDFQDARLSI
ncbi:unnamed protein product [Urochloa humidicola]